MSNFRRFLSSVFAPRVILRTSGGYRLHVESMEARVVPAVLVVTSLEDTVRVDGKVTLREAILSANANAPVNTDVSAGGFGRDTIDFAPSLVGRLSPIAPLPALSDSSGLVLNGNTRIVVDASGAGSTPFVVNSANNELRGLNIVASPSSAIVLNPGARNTILAGNRIGTNSDGLVVPGTGNAASGILIAGATSTTIGGTNPGDGNIIGGNGGAGVSITGASTGYSILGNSFRGNGGPAIDVGGDGAGLNSASPAARTVSPIVTQVVPTSATVRTAYGTAYGVSGSTQRVEFYTSVAFDANGIAQGRTMVGVATVPIGPSGTGTFTFDYSPVSDQPILTATATDSAGNTSEFSGRNRAPSINSPAVRTLATGAGNLVFDGANGISVTDPGNTGTGPIRARVYSTNGRIALGNLSGVGIESGTNGSMGITITGTLAGVNRALAGLTFTPNVGYSGNATVGVRVDDFGGDAIGGTISVERNTTVTIPTPLPPAPGGNIVAPPIVTVSPASGNVGTPIALNITVTLATSNSTDRINTIGIKNLPAGATLSAGTRLSDGSWLLTPAQLTGLTIASPTSGSFDLSVSATTRTTLNDSINATTKALTLTVGNTAPVVTIGTSGSTFPRNAPATFNGSFTDVGTGTWTYTWSVISASGQTIAPQTGTVASVGGVPSFSFTPTLGGQYTVTLTVRDSAGLTGSATRTVGVETAEPIATITAGPTSTPQGQSVTFSGTVGSPLSNAAPFIYRWTATPPTGTGSPIFVDGSVAAAGSIPDFRFTPGPGGNWTVQLQVRDVSGTRSQPSVRILNVANVAPVSVIAAGPGSIDEGETATYTGSFTDAAGIAAGGYSYMWSVRGSDGQLSTTKSGAVGSDGAIPAFSFAPSTSGTYTVSLTVTDREGATSTAVRTLSVIDVKPTVTISGPTSVVSGQSATYTGSFVDPGEDGPYSYQWTLTAPGKAPIVSNGPLAGGQTVPSLTFSAADVGNYSLSLSISDKDGNTTIQSLLVIATASPIVVPPMVSLVGPITGVEGSPLTFRGIQLDNSLVSSAATYTWHLTSTNGQEQTVSGSVGTSFRVADFTFTPFDNGLYTVSLTVTRGGVTSAPDSVVVDVSNVPPTPTITSSTQTVAVGSSANFAGSFTDPAGAFDANYTWLWTATGPNGEIRTLDGSATQVGAVGNFAFAPTSKGVWSIALKVTDIDGGTTTSSPVQMLVTSVPVVVSINSGPTSGSEGASVTYTGSFTDPVGTRTGGYRVRWTATGSNGQSEVSETLVNAPGSSSFSFVPRSGATYTVQMSVSDVENTTASASQVLSVSNVAPTATIVGGPTTFPEGTAVSFTGNVSDPGMAFDGPYTYNWTATGSNGQTVTTQGVVASVGAIPAFVLTPNDSGTYTIVLTVGDRDGLTATATRTATSTNVAPTATFSSSGKAILGNATAFGFTNVADASSIDRATGLTYSYDFTGSGSFTSPGNVSGSASPTASFAFSKTGTHTVRGRITDKDGSFTDYTTQVVVGARDIIVAGAGPGGGPHVRVLDAATGAEKMSFFAYDAAFRGGVNVASGDINGDGVPDIVTAVASGGAPHIKVFDGVSGNQIASFYAFDPSFLGGVTVAVADVNRDGFGDIIVGAGPSGAPHVKAIDGRLLAQVDAAGTIAESALLRSFYAFDKSFTGGVTVAAGDIDKDGFADIVVGAGPGGGPMVAVFSGNTGAEMARFYAFDPTLRNGVNVSVGDLNGDGYDDVIVGAGPGAGPRAIGIDGTRLNENLPDGVVSENAMLQSFMAYDASFRGGVRVGAVDRDGDGSSEMLTGPQQSSSERVFAYSGRPAQPKEAFDIFGGFNGGISLS